MANDTTHDPLAGVLIIDKPVGPTSMDVIRIVRRLSRIRRVGHAGTLDPLASGVLIVCIGRATRLVERFMNTTKRYEAEIDLRAFSATDDAEGEKSPVEIATPPSETEVANTLRDFRGTIMQKPPAYSAMKIGGRRAYKLARKGHEVKLEARPVEIHALDYDYAFPLLRLAIECGKGTYIRSLARDIGLALGTGGYLTALRRTAVGPFSIADAIALDDLPEPITASELLTVDEATQRLQTS